MIGQDRRSLVVVVVVTMMALCIPWRTEAAPQNDLFSDVGKQTFCGCGSRGVKRARIVGGDELQRNGAPWLAALARGRRPHCGAALISGSHLLTAAHCIEGLQVGDLRAWLGVHSLASAGLAMAARSLYREVIEDRDDEGSGLGRTIAAAWSHPQFDASSFRNDIAVLELRFPVKITAQLYPICLPSNSDSDYYAEQMAMVAGWGRLGEQKSPSDVPRKAIVEVWSDERCQNSGYPKNRLKSPILCAGRLSGGLDACQGDSGGPLVLPKADGEMEVIGIVSWGRGCGRPRLPGVYTKVSSFMPFIKAAMSGSCPS